MNTKVLKVLEYNKIITELTEYASSPLGKKHCKDLVPMSDIKSIQTRQQETSDALTRIYKKGSISFSGVKDISSSLMSLSVGSSLGIMELLNISSLLRTCTRIKAYSKKEDDDETKDTLDSRFDELEPLVSIQKEIDRCIISEDTISDDASSTLKSIRRDIKITNNKIHEYLSKVINNQGSKGMLQDNIITMRNNRYCIPVKQEYKGQFQGMIHDQSSTGSTLFIEPVAVVKYNNELAELSIKEQKEIEKILAELSNLCAQEIDALKNNLTILSELDFIFARAMLAKKMKATMPKFNNDKIINIKKARHPLINPSQVVPIDINLGIDFDLLIVTGPNTGGKTVSLKTVGLFTLMGQAGLHIPAFDGSELSVFDEVYADIGDEQSIEQSLSTFSSHMTNTVSILKKANTNSLVLFDELGAGTDPTEGAALCMSILSYLHKQGIRTMATTHYSEVKIFALETKGIENACCEFDISTLSPTYKLLIGIPGKSNAFAISKKLGLPNHIISEAKTFLDSSDKKFEDVISELEKSRSLLEKERSKLRSQKQKVDTLQKELSKKHEKIDASKKKIMDRANEEARILLQDAKDYADETIRNYNKWAKSSGLTKEMEKQRADLRNKLNDVDKNMSKEKKKRPKKKHKAKDFKIGDTVLVLSMGLEGSITSLPNSKGDVNVQMGIFNSIVNISDLEILQDKEEKETKSKTNIGRTKVEKSAYISPEINVIGKTVDEAISIVDKYLDDAYLAHLPQVTIIHGRGTGALKNAVANHLKRTKYVKSYRAGNFGEGDQGVTVVEFK